MNISQRVYNLLLRLYPREHRRQYGELMATHFHDQLREVQTGGELLRLWVHTVIDVALTAPREHAETSPLVNVTPWPEVLLAILPGALPLVLPALGQPTERLILLALGAIYLAMLLLYMWRKRSAAWALPVLGLTGTFAVFWGLYVLNQWQWSGQAPVVPVTLLLACGVVLASLQRSGRRTTVLFGAFLLASLVVAVRSPSGVGLGLLTNLEGAALILLAIVLGLPFAKRYGLLAALFVAGGMHWAIEFSIDPSLQIRIGAWPRLLSLLNFGSMMVFMPLLALRARRMWGQALSLLAPLAAYLLLLIVLPPLFYTLVVGAPASAGVMLQLIIGQAIAAAQLITGMAFALSLYHDRTRRTPAVESLSWSQAGGREE